MEVHVGKFITREGFITNALPYLLYGLESVAFHALCEDDLVVPTPLYAYLSRGVLACCRYMNEAGAWREFRFLGYSLGVFF